MPGDDRGWDLRSILLGSSSLNWLGIGRKTRSHRGALRREKAPRAAG